MDEKTLEWRVERTSIKAWPALQDVLIGDWLLRFADGHTRRANSANPIRSEVGDIEAGIAACEEHYRAQGLPILFRIPSIVDPAIDGRLHHLRYSAEGETLTLYAEIGAVISESDSDVDISSHPSREWLTVMAEFQGYTSEKSHIYDRIVGSIAMPAAFAAFRLEGRFAALAYGVIHDSLLCCESVITDASYRGRGYARRVLATLNAWAKTCGAEGVCLQVEATNLPARALYRSVGLRTELYRYHYRREPPAR